MRMCEISLLWRTEYIPWGLNFIDTQAIGKANTVKDNTVKILNLGELPFNAMARNKWYFELYISSTLCYCLSCGKSEICSILFKYKCCVMTHPCQVIKWHWNIQDIKLIAPNLTWKLICYIYKNTTLLARQKRWRSPFRKRAVNLRKTWHLLKFTGVHESENPRFSSCFAVGELEYSFHYPVVFHYGEQRKTRVYWNLPVG